MFLPVSYYGNCCYIKVPAGNKALAKGDLKKN